MCTAALDRVSRPVGRAARTVPLLGFCSRSLDRSSRTPPRIKRPGMPQGKRGGSRGGPRDRTRVWTTINQRRSAPHTTNKKRGVRSDARPWGRRLSNSKKTVEGLRWLTNMRACRRACAARFWGALGPETGIGSIDSAEWIWMLLLFHSGLWRDSWGARNGRSIIDSTE